MLKHEGVSSFFKGLNSPLFTVPGIYAVMLGSYEMARWAQGIGIDDEMTIKQGMMAGACAGLATCCMLTPMELVKCKMQMEFAPEKANKSSAFQVMKNIVKTQGIRTLYRGNLITICREVPGMAVYFGVYEYLKMWLNDRYGHGPVIPLIAGGISGFVGWVFCYPQDTIKTRLQCDIGVVRQYPSLKWLKDGGIVNCAKDIYINEGFKGFWRGFSAIAVRSILSEAVSFFVYENVKNHLKDKFWKEV